MTPEQIETLARKRAELAVDNLSCATQIPIIDGQYETAVENVLVQMLQLVREILQKAKSP